MGSNNGLDWVSEVEIPKNVTEWNYFCIHQFTLLKHVHYTLPSGERKHIVIGGKKFTNHKTSGTNGKINLDLVGTSTTTS